MDVLAYWGEIAAGGGRSIVAYWTDFLQVALTSIFSLVVGTIVMMWWRGKNTGKRTGKEEAAIWVAFVLAPAGLLSILIFLYSLVTLPAKRDSDLEQQIIVLSPPVQEPLNDPQDVLWAKNEIARFFGDEYSTALTELKEANRLTAYSFKDLVQAESEIVQRYVWLGVMKSAQIDQRHSRNLSNTDYLATRTMPQLEHEMFDAFQNYYQMRNKLNNLAWGLEQGGVLSKQVGLIDAVQKWRVADSEMMEAFSKLRSNPKIREQASKLERSNLLKDKNPQWRSWPDSITAEN